MRRCARRPIDNPSRTFSVIASVGAHGQVNDGGAPWVTGEMHIRPGPRDETLTVQRRAALRRNGSTGAVIIGE